MTTAERARQRFDSTVRSIQQATHLDAVNSAYVARALLWVETETYNTVIPPMQARSFFDYDLSSPPGAKATSFKSYTRTGIARLVTERGQDAPQIALYVNEYFHQFYRLAVSYLYTWDDLLGAEFSSQNGGPALNLDLEFAIGCREAIEKALDQITAFGSAPATTLQMVGLGADVGMVGVLNNPNITQYAVATGASTSTYWSEKTPDEILADLVGIVAAQVAGTFMAFIPTDMLIATREYENISGLSMGDGRSDTVLSYFLKTSQHIKSVKPWNLLEGAGSGGTDAYLVYIKNRRFVRHMLSQDFTQMPPQFKQLSYETLCTAKTAGTVIPFPLSLSLGSGIGPGA